MVNPGYNLHMTERLSEILTEEEKLLALDAFGLAYSIRVNRAIQDSSRVPNYAKLPAEVAERETSELQSQLAELAEQHPDVIRRMNLPLDDLVGITPVE